MEIPKFPFSNEIYIYDGIHIFFKMLPVNNSCGWLHDDVSIQPGRRNVRCRIRTSGREKHKILPILLFSQPISVNAISFYFNYSHKRHQSSIISGISRWLLGRELTSVVLTLVDFTNIDIISIVIYLIIIIIAIFVYHATFKWLVSC